MDAAEIVVEEIKRQHSRVIFDLPTESTGHISKTAHHRTRGVLSFNATCRYLPRIKFALNSFAIESYQYRVIDLRTERIFNRRQRGFVPVRGYAHGVGEPPG